MSDHYITLKPVATRHKDFPQLITLGIEGHLQEAIITLENDVKIKHYIGHVKDMTESLQPVFFNPDILHIASYLTPEDEEKIRFVIDTRSKLQIGEHQFYQMSVLHTNTLH